MDSRLESAYLLDIYSPLLTERQRSVMDLFVNEDLTVSEIASQLSVSRQAVSELIARTSAILCEYDEKLRLVQRYLNNASIVDEILARLGEAQGFGEIRDMLLALKENL